MSLSNYFASKTQKFRCVIIFLSGKQLKIPAGHVTDIAWDGNDPPDDRLKTG